MTTLDININKSLGEVFALIEDGLSHLGNVLGAGVLSVFEDNIRDDLLPGVAL